MNQIDAAFAELNATKNTFYKNHEARMKELHNALDELNQVAIQQSAISDELDKMLEEMKDW